jgi:trimeric autotransporter adhesin
VSVLIRRITLAALVAALAGGMLALPASAKTGPVASASKCKKGKKGKHRKKKRCGDGSQSSTLPGQATHPTATPPQGSGSSGSSQSPSDTTRQMSAISVADNPVLAGVSTSGQVTIDGPAPSGGQSVSLNSDSQRVSFPGGSVVVVPSGQTHASFPIDTSDGPDVTATLTAAIGSSSVQTQLSAVDDPSVASLQLQRRCFTLGSFPSNRVTLDVPASADTTVDLLSSAQTSLAVPDSVTIPSGSTSAFFTVNALLANPSVTVTANPGPLQKTDSASISLTSPTPHVSDLSLNPSSVDAGETPIGTITLDCEALAGGAAITVTSSDHSVAPDPGSVIVDQDELSKSFNITVVGVGTTTITATGPSGTPMTAELQVNSQPD